MRPTPPAPALLRDLVRDHHAVETLPDPDAVLVVDERRWAIEDAFETVKTELGLDRNGACSPASASRRSPLRGWSRRSQRRLAWMAPA